MLKHKIIIDKMSVKQKITLLTNIKCLSEPEYTSLGIPYTSLARLEDILLKTKEGVSANILARSWNTETLGVVTEEIVSRAKNEGVNFVISPSPKIKIDPYSPAISEDPYLSGRLVGAYLGAIHKAEVPSCVSDFKLKKEDVDYLDLELSQRFLYEYFILPFKIAAKQGECHTVMSAVSGPGNGYGDANLGLMMSAKMGLFHVNMNVLCDEHTPEATAAIWREGGIVMDRGASVLEHAYEKYNKIVKAIHKGHATVNDLEDAYADGSAISDEMIDFAVSRVIDFAFMCKRERGEIDVCDTDPAEEDALLNADAQDMSDENADTVSVESEELVESTDTATEDTSEDILPEDDEAQEEEPVENIENYSSEAFLNAIRESIVLLKNRDRILPLKSKSKIAIIGDIAMSDAGEGFAADIKSMLRNPCVGMAKGYLLNSGKSEKCIPEAVRLAAKADVVLLFLGIDSRRLEKISVTKRTELPANQAALLEAMKKYSAKTVAIVGGDILPSASIGDDLGAFVLAPIGGKTCARALADVLTAKYNPSGRLTESYYSSPSATFEKIRKDKNIKKNKIGPFMGYRLYDSSGELIKYPFGYGLSYTRVEYSSLAVSKNRVSFTVRNLGNLRVAETVQVYAGKKDSSYVRPLKELKAFKKVLLGPKQSKRITLTIDDLSIYDEQKKKFITEDGAYEIYVGSSVSDIKLTGKMRVIGSHDKNSTGDKRSDYLLAESNILLDKYTMEAQGKIMKRSKKWMIGYIIGIIFTVLTNAVLIPSQIVAASVFPILGRCILGFIAVFNIFAISFVLLLIVADIVSAKKFRKQKEKESQEHIKDAFADAKLLENVNIYDLFVKEFDEDLTKNVETKSHQGFDLSDYSKFVDDQMNFVVAQNLLVEHATAEGITLGKDVPGNVLAAFATSRMLFLNSYDNEKIRRFTGVLAKYFGTEAYIEEVDESFIDGNLLFAKNEEDGVRRTALVNMISAAADQKEKIHFITLTNLTAELTTNLFSRYIRYLNNPERECVITVSDEKFTIPENVWFLVSMREGESVCNMPVYMAELTTTLDVDYTEIETETEVASSEETEEIEQTEQTDVEQEATPVVCVELRTFGYYQLSFMAEKSKNGFAMAEDLWKKVDYLEEYAGKHSSYRFGNKLWIRLEKYLSVLNSCEFEAVTALDYTLNANIVHVVQIVLNDNPDEETDLLDAMERFFGEDNVPVCRKTIKGVSLT